MIATEIAQRYQAGAGMRATCAEVAEAVGRNRGNVYKQLMELVDGGLLDREEDDYVLPRE